MNPTTYTLEVYKMALKGFKRRLFWARFRQFFGLATTTEVVYLNALVKRITKTIDNNRVGPRKANGVNVLKEAV